jgi:hypothetical protein
MARLSVFNTINGGNPVMDFHQNEDGAYFAECVICTFETRVRDSFVDIVEEALAHVEGEHE